MTPDDNIGKDHNFSPLVNEGGYSANRIKVVGVGGGGNNAINHMYNMGVRDVTFIVANTDRQALNNSPVPVKVLLGPTVTKGRGAGNDPDKARRAAEESAADIDALFDDETDMVFITAGMGGGTGTGASPVIAKIAKERGILTIGIVTIPFLFEGNKKILKALDGANELQKYVDALLIINNERLSEIYPDTDFLNAFGKADDILSMAAMSISEIVTVNGYINLDFNDVDNTLRDGGTAIIATGFGEGPNRVHDAINDALHSPLLKNTDINGSRKLLFNIYFSNEAEESVMIKETKQITEFISNIDDNVDVIWGVSIDKTLGNKVKFTILAAGFDVTVRDDGRTKPTVIESNIQKSDTTSDADEVLRQQRLIGEYGEKYDNIAKIRSEQTYIILQPDQLDNDMVFEVLEQNPTFKRDKKIIANLKNNIAADAEAAAATVVVNKNVDSKTINFLDLD